MAIHVKTHGDLDGVACVLLLQESGLQVVSATYLNYTSIDQAIYNFFNKKEYSEGDTLYITDICPSADVCEFIDQQVRAGAKVQLLDHHKTKLWVNKYTWAKVDAQYSAAKIVLNHLGFTSKTRPYSDLIDAVDAWDMWRLSSPNRGRGETLNALLTFLGKDAFINRFAENARSDQISPLRDFAELINDRKERYVRQVVRSQLEGARCYIDGLGNKYKILFATDYISEIAAAALKDPESDDINYICVVNPLLNTCSLRSLPKEADVRKVAERLSGGGHDEAAGFPLEMLEPIEDQIRSALDHIDD